MAQNAKPGPVIATAETGRTIGREKTLLLAMAVAAPLLAFYGTGRSLWLDEALSADLALCSFSQIIERLKVAAGPPLYYVLLSIWVDFFGVGEIAIRCFSGIAYILSVPMVYLIGRELYDSKTGLICAVLFMVSPLVYSHAQNARMYSLLVLLGLLSTLFFVRVFSFSTNSKLDFSLYVFVNILGTFTHYWYLFIVFAQVTAYALLLPKTTIKPFIASISVSLVPFFGLWTGMLIDQLQVNLSSWIERPELGDLTDTLLVFYGYKPTYPYIDRLVGLAVYAGFILILVVRIENGKVQLRTVSAFKEFLLRRQ